MGSRNKIGVLLTGGAALAVLLWLLLGRSGDEPEAQSPTAVATAEAPTEATAPKGPEVAPEIPPPPAPTPTVEPVRFPTVEPAPTPSGSRSTVGLTPVPTTPGPPLPPGLAALRQKSMMPLPPSLMSAAPGLAFRKMQVQSSGGKLVGGDASDPRVALSAYDRYLAAEPNGPLREQALSGRAASLDEMGDRTQAAAAWRDVLKDYPRGVNAPLARRRIIGTAFQPAQP